MAAGRGSDMDNINLSLDVLAHWYKSAKRNVERGNPKNIRYYPNLEASHQALMVEGYEMALKTVEQLAQLFDGPMQVTVPDAATDDEEINHYGEGVPPY